MKAKTKGVKRRGVKKADPNFIPAKPAWTLKSEYKFIDECLRKFLRVAKHGTLEGPAKRITARAWGKGYVRGLYSRAVWANGEKITKKIREKILDHLFMQLEKIEKGGVI